MFVVAGASGRTGAVVAEALLAAGRKVRVIVRDEAKGAPWRARGAEVAVAGLGDEAALGRALEGAEAAYLLCPPDMRSADYATQSRRLVDAVAASVAGSGLRHLVFLSSMAAQHADGTGAIRVLHEAEQRLGGLPEGRPRGITFLRAAYLLENWAGVLDAARGGTLPTFIRPDRAIPMVATRDVGTTAARILLEGPPVAGREIVELAGPRELSPDDIAAILAGRLGRPAAAQHLPLDAAVPVFTGFGASAAVAEDLRRMFQGIEDGTVGWQPDGTRRLRGVVEATTLFASLLGGRPA